MGVDEPMEFCVQNADQGTHTNFEGMMYLQTLLSITTLET